MSDKETKVTVVDFIKFVFVLHLLAFTFPIFILGKLLSKGNAFEEEVDKSIVGAFVFSIVTIALFPFTIFRR